MLLYPRVVGRGLEGEVEGQLQPERLCFRDKPLEGFEIAQVRVDGVMPALGRSNGPRGARVVGSRLLFFPFRKDEPMGWIGGR